MGETHKGACFCGAVEIEATGAPALMGYCHCEDCRKWSAGPVNAFTLWAPDSVKVTKGEDSILTYAKTDRSLRKSCTKCGGHIMSAHPGMGMTDVYASTIPSLKFEPAFHVFYAETVLKIVDGLPKFRDMPKDAGGSGETVPE
ncbi:GFA family protein [Pikeienuella piscinae]|uniref:GFA family protein n=1 Tax=Pikeienuella piscinae TaxID=2748098 RepID=A0A7L5BX02_9RHOB|nr:GFA family protein [Pikeienuella piscinae]QIE54414.1 GFA family protein [Pikeienuella piscinae]